MTGVATVSPCAAKVHGSGPLLSNLCKSIAIDDDDEDGSELAGVPVMTCE